MCNLSQGIEEKGIAKGLEKGIIQGRAEGRAEGRVEGRAEGRAQGESVLILRMHKNGFSAEEIASATDKDLAEVKAILENGEPIPA